MSPPLRGRTFTVGRDEQPVMATRRRVLAAGAALAALGGCTADRPGASGDGLGDPPTLASPAFEDGTPIPTKHTCDGAGVSPPLTVSTVPDDAEPLALVVDDPDANGYVHWLLWNVPADTTEIPEDVPQTETVDALDGAAQGTNSADMLGYFPCCPPPEDDAHTYRFRLSAVGSSLDVDPGARARALRDALDGASTATATLTGTYGR